MLTSQDERKSFRRVARAENGNQVLAMNLAYERREVVLQIERIDTGYCDEHPEDVQAAVCAFIGDMNASLKAAGLPNIKA